MVDHRTLCWKWTVARIHTFQVATRQRRWTIVVVGALWSLASLIRVTQVSFGTVASWSVISIGRTKRVDTTLCHRACIQAFVVDAGLCQWTVAITATSNCRNEYLSVNKSIFKEGENSKIILSDVRSRQYCWGLPVKPSLQTHTARCSCTWHRLL